MKFFHYTYTTWFGLGLSPKAPGTLGSLGAIPFAFLLIWLGFAFPILQLGPIEINALFPIAWFLFFSSVPSINRVILLSGRKDPQFVVIDEVAGQLVAFSFISVETFRSHPSLFLVGLAFFRFFDILKPFGIKRLEKLPRAWGVLADDMLGGLYAGISVWISAHFIPN